MPKPIVLVTTPSLSPRQNVSGIANLTRLWIENNSYVTYRPFIAGKTDKTRRNIRWMLSQIQIVFAFFKKTINDDVDIVHINMPLEVLSIIRDCVLAIICFLCKKPYILHLRGGYYNQTAKIPIFLRSILQAALANSSKVIAQGDAELTFICSRFDIDRNRIVVLPNSAKIPLRQKNKVFNDKPLNLIFLGRIDKDKGLTEIVDGLRYLPPNLSYVFNFAGAGRDLKWLLDYCRIRGIQDCLYHGVIDGEAKRQFFEESDIFLLPSYYEGIPNAMIEAMSYGIVPIVSAVGSIPDIIQDGQNGLIVPVKNSEAITDAIMQLAGNNELYQTLSNNARNTISNKYSLDKYLDRLNEIYSEILRFEYARY